MICYANANISRLEKDHKEIIERLREKDYRHSDRQASYFIIF